MRRLAALALLFSACAGEAQATGEIVCNSADGAVGVNLLVSRSDALLILRSVITINDKTWSSDSGVAPGSPILAGQAFEDDRQLLADFAEEPAGAIVARLRAFSLSEGDDFVSAGVFSFKELGAWAVDCSERG